MKTIVILLFCSLIVGVDCRAEEKISYTISITIPKIIEVSKPIQPITDDSSGQEETSEDHLPSSRPRPIVVVKTIMNQP